MTVMPIAPVVLRGTGLSRHLYDHSTGGALGAFSRRVIGIIQYCGICDADYHSGSACGRVRFSGTTRATRVTSALVQCENESKGIFAVLCVRNAEPRQSLLIEFSDKRYSVTLVRGDLLVAPAGSALCFGGTSGSGTTALAAEYFVATFHKCVAAVRVPDGFGFVALPETRHDKDGALSATKTEILYPLRARKIKQK